MSIMFSRYLFKIFRCRLFLSAFLLFIFFASDSVVQGQFNFSTDGENTALESDEFTPSKYGPRRGVKQEQTWVAGIVLEAGSLLDDVTITMPVPTGWFEQEVKTYRYVKGKNAIPRGVDFRTINNGAKEAVIKFSNLRLNNKLEIILEFDTINYEVDPPENTEIFAIPKRVSKEVSPYLKASPKIEIDDSKVSSTLRKKLREITNDKQTDWDKVEAIYRYVQRRVKYNDANKSLPAKGVKALLAMPEDKCEGDCKDLCSLFVAMCRLSKVPARLVRLPEHCYAEFYLELSNDAESKIEKEKEKEKAEKMQIDKSEKESASSKSGVKQLPKKSLVEPRGFWFPCQVAGTYSFGGIHERQVILQKGDSFPDLENLPNGKKQFLTEVFEGSLQQGSPNPIFKFIHDVKVK